MSSSKLLLRRARLKVSKPQAVGLSLGLVAMVVTGFMYVRSHAATTTFRFAAFSDTKAGTNDLARISPEIVAMNPVFGLYPGDLCDSGPNASCLDAWKSAMNGGDSNNLLDRMFATRGNHDSSGASYWSSAFDFAGIASRIGATNFTGDNFTYSFDYGNSHFIGVDAPGGDSVNISDNQVDWVDQDLTAAEARGVVHSFAWWHGPVHPQGGHTEAGDDQRFIDVFGKHESFEAVFSGHEHNIGVTKMDSRWNNSGHVFYEVVTGSAGAGTYACESGRSDFCNDVLGFTMIDVNGADVTINLYQQGSSSAMHSVHFTATNVPSPTATATPAPTATATVAPSVSPSPSVSPTATPVSQTPTPLATPVATATPRVTATPRPTVAPTPTPDKSDGDIDGNGKVDIADLTELLTGWSSAGQRDDVNNDGRVNVYDLSILLSNWNQ